ncbi:DUF4435 domain-containing protein [Marivirga tractuosa]|uniref:DUF4435 domain-containing protein n=1 Tax=Marivirga tractuosa TaxID=1006 RepID=UPI0035D10701
MDFIDIFFQKRNDYQSRAGSLKLKQEYKKFSKTVHLFLESEDDFEFYRHFLNKFYSGYKYYPYAQKGKQNVIKAYKEMDWDSYSRYRILFLVDKDYDDLLNRDFIKASNFFKTKYYSIENYLVNEKILISILNRVYNIKDETLQQEALDSFKASYQIFVKHILIVTACILIYRMEEKHINLEKLKMEKMFYFNGTQIEKLKYLEPNLHQSTMQDPTLPSSKKGKFTNKKLLEYILQSTGADDELINYKKILTNLRKVNEISEPKKVVRGKFELWFFFSFIESLENTLIKDLNNEIDNFNRTVSSDMKKPKYSRKYEINHKNVFDLLSSKVETPTDVKNFLKKNKRNGYISKIRNQILKITNTIEFNLRMKY